VTENAGFNAKVQRNHGLDFVKKAAQIVAKKSTSLQLLTSLLSLCRTFAVAGGYEPLHNTFQSV